MIKFRLSPQFKNSTAPKWFKWIFYALEDWAGYFLAKENKIFLISYPKCGTTWLQIMLVQILAKGYNIELENSSIPPLTLWTKKYAELPTVMWEHDFGQIWTEDGTPSDHERLWIYGGRKLYHRTRVILLVRDPRDTVISNYYQVTKRTKIPMKFNNLSDFIRHPKFGFDRIIRFYTIWYRHLGMPKDLLLIRYEDLLTNGVDILDSLLKFIYAKEIDRSIIEEVYNFSNPNNLKKLEKEGKIQSLQTFGKDKEKSLFRRAKTNVYKDELSPEDLAYCNKRMASLPKVFQYFPD